MAKFTEDDLQKAAHNAMVGVMRGDEFEGIVKDAVRAGTLGILRSPEATNIIRDAAGSRADFVPLIDLLYQQYLDRRPLPEDVLFWSQKAETNRWGVTALDAEFRKSAAEAGTVRRAYQIHLRRLPRDHEVAHWANGERTIAQVFDGIAGSPEAQEKR